MINSITKTLLVFLLAFIPFLSIGAIGHSVAVPTAVNEGVSENLSVNSNKLFSRKSLEAKIGRKLSLKERLAFMILKKQLKKQSRKKVFFIPPAQLDTGIEGCSTVYFKKEDIIIEARIIEINKNEITYKVCGDDESPEFKAPMRQITHIFDQRGRTVYGDKSIRRDYIAPSNFRLDSTIQGCGKILLYVGDIEINAKNIRIEDDEVLYELCAAADSTTQGIYLNKVSYIEDGKGNMVYGSRNGNSFDNSYSSRKAKTALILGILSILFTFFYGLGFILGIIAWSNGNKALKRIKSGEEPDLNNSRKKARTGKVLGMVSVIITLIFIIAVFWALLLLY